MTDPLSPGMRLERSLALSEQVRSARQARATLQVLSADLAASLNIKTRNGPKDVLSSFRVSTEWSAFHHHKEGSLL